MRAVKGQIKKYMFLPSFAVFYSSICSVDTHEKLLPYTRDYSLLPRNKLTETQTKKELRRVLRLQDIGHEPFDFVTRFK